MRAKPPLALQVSKCRRAEAGCGHSGVPGPIPALVVIRLAGTCWPPSRARTSVTYSRITATGGRAGPPMPRIRARSRPCRGRAQTAPRTAETAWPPGLPGSAVSTSVLRGRRKCSYEGHAIFYVGVPDVEAALQKAESLGGTRGMGPERNPGTDLFVGHFSDPEGHLIGLASAV